MVTFVETKAELTPANSRTHISFSFDINEPVKSMEITFKYFPKVYDNEEAKERILNACMEEYLAGSDRENVHEDWKKTRALRNLLSISLDGPEGFRGNAQRSANEQFHKISEDFASNGFIKGRLPTGMWKVTISVQAVISPTCTYELKVECEES